jgi:hypothetical protein
MAVFLVIAREMRPIFFLILFLTVHHTVFSQRVTRRSQQTTLFYHAPVLQSRYFSAVLTNTDSVPILLKLGICKRLDNGDTLNLARISPYPNPSMGEYYLHYLVDQENEDALWYTLQEIRPNDTLRFIVRLKDFDNTDSAKFSYSYTREIKEADSKNSLNSDHKLFVMKEPREFNTTQFLITGCELNTLFAKVGLDIYLSFINQQ